MIHEYRRMTDDPVRVAAFQRAISSLVSPGDVVVDLGCAMGNFSVFACRAGAARVYALELEPIIEVAREVVEANGFGDRVSFLSGSSTVLDVPERADVLIFEDFSHTLLSPTVARTLEDAAARWLAPGGILLPGRARLVVAPVEDREGHEEVDRFRDRGEHSSSVDLTCTRHRAFCSPYTRRLDGKTLPTNCPRGQEIDLRHVGEPRIRLQEELTASREAAIHGLTLWFELNLADEWLGTGPLSPPTAWQHTVFPLEDPLLLEAGQKIRVSLEGGPFGRDMVWQWQAAAGEEERSANSLEGTPLDPDQLVRWEADHVPELTPELDLDRFILGSIDGQLSEAEIAQRAAERFPRLLASTRDAQRRVVAVLSRRSR